MNEKITFENMLSIRPPILKADSTLNALTQITAEALENLNTGNMLSYIYSRIDYLDEDVIDAIAESFKVDWYDRNYTIDEKRQTVKNSWNVHRRLGTGTAVVDAINAIYPNTQIKKWYEYGGKPYHFKIQIDAVYEDIDAEKHARLLDKIKYYKPLRDVLDTIEYTAANAAVTEYSGAAFVGMSCAGMTLTAVQ
jgi:phage tail P2-like protein